MDTVRELYSVVTISEAARLWALHPETLRYCIQRGLLSARRSGHVWLIPSREMLERYGHPVHPMSRDSYSCRFITKKTTVAHNMWMLTAYCRLARHQPQAS